MSSEASRTFCPLRPIASESWSSSTTAWMVLLTPSLNTRATLAGASASLANRSGSDDHGTMSMRSPPSSLTTVCTREPLRPTQAPTGSMLSSRENTAIFVRLPTSRAVARISTMLCWISGTSSLKSAFTNRPSARLRMRRGPFGVSSTRLSDGANRLALVEVLAMVLLAIRDDRLRLAELVQHDDELAALDLLDLAGQQVADARRELVADLGALAFADALNDALLGGLDGGAAEDGEVQRLFHHVAGLEALVEQLGLLERDLARGVLDGLDDGLEEGDLDLALRVIDVDFGLHGRAVLLRQRGHEAVLQQPVQLRPVELLRVRQLTERGQHLCGTDHPRPR